MMIALERHRHERLSSTVTETPPPQSEPTGPVPATGLKRFLFVVLGLFFVGMAYLGAILPGLPTTPWVLLASYFFSRSSPRLERWLKRSPFFGTIIHDWEKHRGIRRPVKILASCIMVPVVSCSIAFTNLPVWVKCCIGGLAVTGLCVIWLVVPTAPTPGRSGPGARSHRARPRSSAYPERMPRTRWPPLSAYASSRAKDSSSAA